MPEQDGRMTFDETEALFEFLLGGTLPAGINTKYRPRKMTPKQAFTLIYILQEAFHVIPDCFELCGECGYLFDSEAEGHVNDRGKFYCDRCTHLCNCKKHQAERRRH